VGWAIGSSHIMKHLKTVHQNSVYHCATAAQVAVAAGFQTEYERLGSPESYFQQLPATLNHKRNKLAACLESDEPLDSRFVKWLIKKKGLAAIPVSAFYSPEHSKEFQNYVRFCFTKEDSTLCAAEEILKKWSSEK
ncbi:hypothetical protein CRUP_010191, partial [Coryphaenoides rupestris]